MHSQCSVQVFRVSGVLVFNDVLPVTVMTDISHVYSILIRDRVPLPQAVQTMKDLREIGDGNNVLVDSWLGLLAAQQGIENGLRLHNQMIWLKDRKVSAQVCLGIIDRAVALHPFLIGTEVLNVLHTTLNDIISGTRKEGVLDAIASDWNPGHDYSGMMKRYSEPDMDAEEKFQTLCHNVMYECRMKAVKRALDSEEDGDGDEKRAKKNKRV